MVGSPLSTTGELGNVAEAAAPQFEFEVGAVVVVVLVELVTDWACWLASTQASTCVVPPMLLVRMTSPNSAIAKPRDEVITRIAMFFTSLTIRESAHGIAPWSERHKGPAIEEVKLDRGRCCQYRRLSRNFSGGASTPPDMTSALCPTRLRLAANIDSRTWSVATPSMYGCQF